MAKIRFSLVLFFSAFLCFYTVACSGDTHTFTPKADNEVIFTNRQGTINTICNNENCTKHIAEYGDTLFCPEHSNTCLLCGTYINADDTLCGWCSNTPGYEDKSENIYGQYYYAKVLQSPSPSSFINKFGTSSTKCAHSGCNNYIASSGDTNCCEIHSKTCANCRCYIDEDATFCMDCIEKALNKK